MADAYGTVMIAKRAVPFEDIEASVRRWAEERQVSGFRHEDVMLCDDGVTVVMSVFFDSKQAYAALSDDPEQDRWWREEVSPMIDGDPTWLDGTWRLRLDA